MSTCDEKKISKSRTDAVRRGKWFWWRADLLEKKFQQSNSGEVEDEDCDDWREVHATKLEWKFFEERKDGFGHGNGEFHQSSAGSGSEPADEDANDNQKN